MITRIVKMTIQANNIKDFENIFYDSESLILAFKGCKSVKLLKDLNNECVLFTLSLWNSEEDLNAYRKSSLFITTWSRVKPLFAQKAEAWSLSSC